MLRKQVQSRSGDDYALATTRSARGAALAAENAENTYFAHSRDNPPALALSSPDQCCIGTENPVFGFSNTADGSGRVGELASTFFPPLALRCGINGAKPARTSVSTSGIRNSTEC